MLHYTHRELAPGVGLTAVQTQKFKTCFLGVTFLAPLEEKTASGYALLPRVLHRGTRRHPDMESFSAALDELYGGAIEPMVRKKGETLCVGFSGSFLDDAYVPGGESVLPAALSLMGELLLTPAGGPGGFREEYFQNERENLIQKIRGEINEKRQYAMTRLIRLMCQGEPYGVNKRGSEQTAAALNNEGLWAQYQTLLHTLPLELYYCGSAPADQVEAQFRKILAPLLADQRVAAPPIPGPVPALASGPRVFEDRMEVSQGKLTMGFRIGANCLGAQGAARILLLDAVFGGSTNSKLFLNVREKLSLCYYASSTAERVKGVLLVSSGVEFDKFEEAKNEILAQMEAIRAGQVSDQELEGAKKFVAGSLRANLDAQTRLENYWLNQAITGENLRPQDLAAAVEKTTLAELVELAGQIQLDSIYFLNGKEGAAHAEA